ncbi:S100P-binding protein-like [Leucoraja erinacea]|uniref:S100P-binding protein-like n=1 Tax=Leucoraja erinaceus TaxID=7782 RepID=UPI002453C2E7|nr:S100P-binding protein-like [Leucoraja erinacea]
MKEIMDGAQDGIICNLELKIDDSDNASTGSAAAKELRPSQCKRGISSNPHVRTAFKRPRVVEEMHSLPCVKKPHTNSVESLTGRLCSFQSHNWKGDPGATVPADKGQGASSRALDESEDLDDSLLELEEKDLDEDDLLNLTSEEIDKILQESDDDADDNTDSLRFVDALNEHQCRDNSRPSASLPNTPQLPKSCLVRDELETTCSGNVSLTDFTVLKLTKEVNQSLKVTEQRNHNCPRENTELEISKQPYYLSANKVAEINPKQNGADAETERENHEASSSEEEPDAQEKMLRTASTSPSPNVLNGDNMLTLSEQNIPEEQADDGRVKEPPSIPGSSNEVVPDLKAASRHKQSIAESPKGKASRKCTTAKSPRARPETRQKTRLNAIFDEKIERQKHTYFKDVSNHLNEKYKNPGPIPELLFLMDEVAMENHFPFQQHPSDLTARNYMKRHRFVETDLHEWASLNGDIPRFGDIAFSLQRDPLP